MNNSEIKKRNIELKNKYLQYINTVNFYPSHKDIAENVGVPIINVATDLKKFNILHIYWRVEKIIERLNNVLPQYEKYYLTNNYSISDMAEILGCSEWEVETDIKELNNRFNMDLKIIRVSNLPINVEGKLVYPNENQELEEEKLSLEQENLLNEYKMYIENSFNSKCHFYIEEMAIDFNKSFSELYDELDELDLISYINSKYEEILGFLYRFSYYKKYIINNISLCSANDMSQFLGIPLHIVDLDIEIMKNKYNVIFDNSFDTFRQLLGISIEENGDIINIANGEIKYKNVKCDYNISNSFTCLFGNSKNKENIIVSDKDKTDIVSDKDKTDIVSDKDKTDIVSENIEEIVVVDEGKIDIISESIVDKEEKSVKVEDSEIEDSINKKVDEEKEDILEEEYKITRKRERELDEYYSLYCKGMSNSYDPLKLGGLDIKDRKYLYDKVISELNYVPYISVMVEKLRSYPHIVEADYKKLGLEENRPEVYEKNIIEEDVELKALKNKEYFNCNFFNTDKPLSLSKMATELNICEVSVVKQINYLKNIVSSDKVDEEKQVLTKTQQVSNKTEEIKNINEYLFSHYFDSLLEEVTPINQMAEELGITVDELYNYMFIYEKESKLIRTNASELMEYASLVSKKSAIGSKADIGTDISECNVSKYNEVQKQDIDITSIMFGDTLFASKYYCNLGDSPLSDEEKLKIIEKYINDNYLTQKKTIKVSEVASVFSIEETIASNFIDKIIDGMESSCSNENIEYKEKISETEEKIDSHKLTKEERFSIYDENLKKNGKMMNFTELADMVGIPNNLVMMDIITAKLKEKYIED